MHPFLNPLKTSENHTIVWCFQGVEKGALETNGLRNFLVNFRFMSLKYFQIFVVAYVKHVCYTKIPWHGASGLKKILNNLWYFLSSFV